jgi:hypothetical protein
MKRSKFDLTTHPRLNIAFLGPTFDLWLAILKNCGEGGFEVGDDLASEYVGMEEVIGFFEVFVSEP